MTYDHVPEFQALDESIRAYFAAPYPEHLMTDWLVVGTGMRVANLPDDVSDSYKLLYQHSAASGYHAMLGLLADATNTFLNPGGSE